MNKQDKEIYKLVNKLADLYIRKKGFDETGKLFNGNIKNISLGFEEKNGERTGRKSIVFHVKEKKEKSELKKPAPGKQAVDDDELIPNTIGGYITDVTEKGSSISLDAPDSKLIQEHSPVKGGMSMNRWWSPGAATFGCLVYYKGSQPVMLSNRHVFWGVDDVEERKEY